MFLYALTADIIKMYRQILVHPSQTRYQRILWRNTISFETYELTTVTYGTLPASYLATRCLKHLAESLKEKYPVGSIRVERDFYVDDLLTRADSINEAREARDEIVALLRKGGFELDKWLSNSPELLDHLGGNKDLTINDGGNSSVLGICWNKFLDAFRFSYKPIRAHAAVTKRSILSEVASLFDPLGLLGPILLLAKLITQELWQSDVHWDESIPTHIYTKWDELKDQLPLINRLTIPRCVKYAANPRSIQLHGFCDASQRAYGACVYIRTRVGINDYRSEFLCCRSRVAPIKSTSLPKLELAAALLLSQLVDKIKTAINLADIAIFLWSDSTITLNWISSPSRKWAVFVANRVDEIQRITDVSNWRHISSSHNPADILSRGLEPRNLIDSPLWWHGPQFLASTEDCWPDSRFNHLENVPEQRGSSVAFVAVELSVIEELITRFSSLNKACRVLAYYLRFSEFHRPERLTIFVSHSEILSALHLICKIVQERSFPGEYKALAKGNTVDPFSPLLTLSPFIALDGLIRVGGRFQKSDLGYDECHPILLPRGYELIKRVIEQEHIRNSHAGVQATMAAVRQRFWSLSLRSTTRKIIKRCVICFKSRPTFSEVIMSSLPPGRVIVSRPFYHCGVDYAGPLFLRDGKRRNARISKAYVSIFVCFATKAVHIELVSDLTSSTFIEALKRFAERRGKPACIYSDNRTTFVGAQGQLKQFLKFLQNDETQSEIKHFLRDQKTSWIFIPPNAPHMWGVYGKPRSSRQNTT